MGRYDVEKIKRDRIARSVLKSSRSLTSSSRYDEVFLSRNNILRPIYSIFDFGRSPAKVLDYGCGS